MQSRHVLVGLVGLVIFVGSLGASCGRPVDEAHFTYALWSAPGSPDDLHDLARALRTDGMRAAVFESRHDWLRSSAHVLVLRTTTLPDMPLRIPLTMDGWEPLLGRRVLAIGGEAGRVFDAIGLTIGWDRSALFRGSPAYWDVEVSETLLPRHGPVPTHSAPVRAGEVPEFMLNSAMFVPHGKPYEGVEILVRLRSDLEYAPIVREGNHVLVGVGVPVTQWSDDARELVVEVAKALASSPARGPGRSREVGQR